MGMGGNVREWTDEEVVRTPDVDTAGKQILVHDAAEVAHLPVTPEGTLHMARGGSWESGGPSSTSYV